MPCNTANKRKIDKLLLSKLKTFVGTSLVVQWVRHRAPNAGAPSSGPGQGREPHMPQLRAFMQERRPRMPQVKPNAAK